MGASVSLTSHRHAVPEQDIATWDATLQMMTFLLTADGSARFQRQDRESWAVRLGAETLLTAEHTDWFSARAPRRIQVRVFDWPDGRVGIWLAPGSDPQDRSAFVRAVHRLGAQLAPRGKVGQRWSEDRFRAWTAQCYRAVGMEPLGWPAGAPPAAITLFLEGTRPGGYRTTVRLEHPGEGARFQVAGRSPSLRAPRETVVLPVPPLSPHWLAWMAAREGRWWVAVAPELTLEEADGIGPARLGIVGPHILAPQVERHFAWQGR